MLVCHFIAEDVLLSVLCRMSRVFNEVNMVHVNVMSVLRSLCVMGQVWNVRFKTLS